MKVNKHIKDLMGNDKDLKTADDDLASDSSYIYSFNCPPIDIPLGGGIFSGKVYEFYGEESHGKSTFAELCIIPFYNYWKARGEDKIAVLWIESESALDKMRAKFMGVPIEIVLTKETDVFEEGAEKIKTILKRCVQKKMKIMIVWDTIAAAGTLSEKTGDKSAGLPEMEKPKLIKKMFRDITNDLGLTDSVFIVVNQVYTKMTMFGDPLDSPGGKGLRHHASVRSRVRRGEEIPITLSDGSKKVYAITIELTHVKNKLTTPKQKSIAVVDLQKGLDPIETCLRFLKAHKITSKPKGASHTKMMIPNNVVIKEETNGKTETKIPEIIEISFQNTDQFRKLMDEKYPHLEEWMHYVIYNYYAKHDPLLKVRNIKRIWGYEMKFFGEEKTTINDEEKEIAELIFKDLKRGIGAGEWQLLN